MSHTDIILSLEEKELQESIDQGVRSPLSEKDKQEEIAKLKAGFAGRKKRKPITIRVFESDLQKLKIKASQEGLPYQTLITSLLHKYATQ